MPDRDALSRQAKPIVTGIGEVLWDELPAGKALGGAPANFAYHARALGAEAFIVSRVGQDAAGDEILSRLESIGLCTDYIARDPDHPTGAVSVSLDAGGKPTYAIRENAAWDHIGLSPRTLELAHRTEAVCFGTLAQRSEPSRSTIRAFLKATAAGALRIFDVNLRQDFYDREIIDFSLRLTTILKLNNEELPVLADLLAIKGDPLTVMEALARRYRLRAVALTKGARGSVLYAGDRFFTHHGYAVSVMDTVGAGDAFAAALALGFLQGMDPDAINDRANRLAAFICSQPSATPPIPEDLLEGGETPIENAD